MLSGGISRGDAPDARRFYECWKLYEGMTVGAEVIRSGFWVSGIYPKPPNGRSYLIERGESDSEHQHATAILAIALYLWFPEISLSRENVFDTLLMALAHDIGERDIGDLPNDGNRDDEKKKAAEFAVMEEVAGHMPSEYHGRFLDMYRRFASCSETNAGGAGAFVGLCDKFDALLKLVRYERDGHVGHDGVVGGQSERNAMITKTIGTDVTLDVWAYAVLDAFRRKVSYPRFRAFLGVLTAAVIDVRGKPFDWAAKFYEEFDIPVDELKTLIRQEKERA